MTKNPQELWKERFAIFVQKMVNKRKEECPQEPIHERQVWFSKWMKDAMDDVASLKKKKAEENAGRPFQYHIKSGLPAADLLCFSIDYHIILHVLLRERLISPEMNKRLEIEEINARKLMLDAQNNKRKKKAAQRTA